MNFFWKILFGGGKTSLGVDVGLLLLRLWVGLPMAFVYGRAKLPPSPGFISGVGDMGFPMPTLFAWCAAMSEFLGGVLIALGLMTRPAAAALAFTMFIAVFKMKGDLGYWEPDRMNPTHYLVGCLVLLLAGAGRLSCDTVLRPKGRDRGMVK